MVVETMKKEHLSIYAAMQEFGINDHKIIERWERIYLEEGPEGLSVERRGRSSTGRSKKLPKEVEELNPLNEAQMETIRYRPTGEIYSTDKVLSHQLSEKLNLNGKSTYLKENRATAYQNLLKVLKREKVQGKWSKTLLKNMWDVFCKPNETGAYREYVGVYEYWLKRWMHK